MNIGDNVKEFRERAGMTQQELADRSGLTQARISRLESGKVKQVKSGALEPLARALGVKVDDLVTTRITLYDGIGLRDDLEMAVLGDASDILRRYGNLSPQGREQVSMFLRFVEQQERLAKRPGQEASSRPAEQATQPGPAFAQEEGREHDT